MSATKHELKLERNRLREMELELIRLQPRWRNPEVRRQYQRLHLRWMTEKAQMRLDV